MHCQTFRKKKSITQLKKEKMAKLSKNKVKAMLAKDMIVVACDNAPEVDSAFETAKQARSEMGDRAATVKISKSNVTLTVVVRTGI